MAVNIRATLLIESTPAAGATDVFTATRPFKVYDVHQQIVAPGAQNTVLSRDAGGGGAPATMCTLSNAGLAGDIVRAGVAPAQIVPAQDDFVETDELEIAAVGVTNSLVYIAIIPRLIQGAG